MIISITLNPVRRPYGRRCDGKFPTCVLDHPTHHLHFLSTVGDSSDSFDLTYAAQIQSTQSEPPGRGVLFFSLQLKTADMLYQLNTLSLIPHTRVLRPPDAHPFATAQQPRRYNLRPTLLFVLRPAASILAFF